MTEQGRLVNLALAVIRMEVRLVLTVVGTGVVVV